MDDDTRHAALEARLSKATARVDGVLVAICAAQQLLVVAGAALFQAGVVQPKNVSSVLVKSLLDAALAFLSWWIIGYALAFSPTAGGFIGADQGNFALRDVDPGPLGLDRFLWTSGAVTVSSTIFGRAAYSERANLLPSMVFTLLSTSLVYPVLVHWSWSEGWLSSWGAHPDAAGVVRPMLSGSSDSNGMIDSSGCGFVHLAGACMALMGTTIIGPRTGRWAIGVRSDAVEYGNKTLQYLGTLLIWFASYGVYLGPILLWQESSLAGQAVVNITLSASGGCLGAALLCAAAEHSIDVTIVLGGIVSGLVAVSGNLAVVLPWHAFLTGLVGSVFFYGGRRLLWWLRIDDPGDAIGVHGFTGMWGLWAVGVFCTDENVVAAGHINANSACKRGEQLGVQVVGSLVIMSWSLGTSAFLLGVMRACRMPLRVSDEIEEKGLDVLFGAPTDHDDAQNDAETDKETSNTPCYAGYDANAHDPWSLQPIPSVASPLAAQGMFGAPGVDVDTNWGEMGGASRQDSAWFGMGGPGLAGQDENAENGTHFGGLLHYTQGLDADANTPGHNEMALSTYPPVVTTPAAVYQSHGPGSGHASDAPGHHVNVGFGSEGTIGGQQQHHVMGPWIQDSYAQQMPAAHHTRRDMAMDTPQPSHQVPPHLHHQHLPVTASAVPHQSTIHPQTLQGPGRYAQHMAAAHHSVLHTSQPSLPHVQHMPATASAVAVPYQPTHQAWATDTQMQVTHAQFSAQSGTGDASKMGNMGTSQHIPTNATAAASNGRDPWHTASQALMTSPGPPKWQGLHPSPALDVQNGSMC